MRVCVCVCVCVCACVMGHHFTWLLICPVETAVNIGYSSQLLTGNMKVFVVDKENDKEVHNQLMDIQQMMTEPLAGTPVDNNSHDVLIQPSSMERPEGVAEGSSFGIVINGHSLVSATPSSKQSLNELMAFIPGIARV